MKIYTKTGDKGKTSLLGGTRVSKSHERIDAYGTIDELNSYIGLLKDMEVNQNRTNILKKIQNTLFSIGSLLAVDPEKPNIKLPHIHAIDVRILEKEIDSMEEELPMLQAFILPGGHINVSFCHIARTVCRRAERAIIKLNENSKLDELIITYINRLSDFLFVLSRTMAKDLNAEETLWES